MHLIIFVKYFQLPPSVLFGEGGMDAHGKKNSYRKVVGTRRIFYNKRIQQFRRLALNGDPYPKFHVLKENFVYLICLFFTWEVPEHT